MTMSEQERYEQIDLPFYRAEIAPFLPPEVLDFHTHTWERDHWIEVPWRTDAAGGKYMVTEEHYSADDLTRDLRRVFPDRTCKAVCFGHPTPVSDFRKTNAAAAAAGARPGLFPLIVAGRGLMPVGELERQVCEQGFFGYKVRIPKTGDDYGQTTVQEMLGPEEMALADELRLVVLLHVPRADRLADPVVQQGVREVAKSAPNARIVLAHCGRCYLPDQMRAAIGSIADLENVFMDCSMVMVPQVLQMAFEHLGPGRVLFATDLPVAAMRGRRVYVMDHWVDVVLEGYPPSAYRVPSDDIHATFMVWEIALALRRAGEMCGLSDEQMHGVFHDNGMALLERVMDGKQMERALARQA